jgi:large subunit ribosomal protein L22
MGRAFRYQRRLTHILVTVAEKKPVTEVTVVAPEPEETKKTTAKPATKKAAVKKAPAKKTAAKKTATKKASK